MRSATVRTFKSPQQQERQLLGETTVIRFHPIDAVSGFELLLHNGQVQALPNNTYIVGPEHISLLEQAGIPYAVEK